MLEKLFKDYILDVELYRPTMLIRPLYARHGNWIRMMGNESPYPPLDEAIEEGIKELHRWSPIPRIKV